MNNDNFLHVAAYQGKVTEKSPKHSLEKTIEVMQYADAKAIDILSMPESFLHGYLNSKEEALQFSIDLQSTEFAKICEEFYPFQKTTLLLGLNERCGDQVFNTVVVIEQGKYLGKYRKAYTYPPYDYFSLGREFPLFKKKGIQYGIIICIDSIYREPAYLAALHGAQVIFCPMFNRVAKDDQMVHFLHLKNHFIARAFDNDCWLICSDIIWNENDLNTCPGYSCIVSRDGNLVAQGLPFTENLISYAIPLNSLNSQKKGRFLGNPELFKFVKITYDLSRKT